MLEHIYSEKFDMESFVQNRDTSDKLSHIYAAIEISTTLTEPISKKDIEAGLMIIKTIEDKVDATQYEDEILLHKTLAKISWDQKVERIKDGKAAYKKNKYSYAGSIYMAEKTGKKPCSVAEREKWKKLTNDIEAAELNYEKVLSETKEKEEQESNARLQAVIDQMVAEMNERRKNMTQEEIQKEIEEAEIERQEIINQWKEHRAKRNST